MKKPIRLLRNGQIAYIGQNEVVADDNENLYVSRETSCFDNREDGCVMVQRIGNSLVALQSDLEIEPRRVSLRELQTADYIRISERKPFLMKGFDPD